ncbi:uncharacterized protein LAESUDRAFT_502682 [Laetiporus sulphureus 93-53]|uniref:Uncharacterized protein n=1 Tax=Laetiporus sulphureus 93-53 TaxID=1314785 RepID=A0A165BF67_9APHY|nr:uncharacterized protein LAESUDRAFT_502682 [Laetiporus sulphureus 93-53]KZT00925.1 hypothetical protein LAESUDRAFT_502682 [Laetiporus sulphureus 93-53]
MAKLCSCATPYARMSMDDNCSYVRTSTLATRLWVLARGHVDEGTHPQFDASSSRDLYWPCARCLVPHPLDGPGEALTVRLAGD